MHTRILVIFAIGSTATFGASPDANALMSQAVKVTEGNWAQAPNYSFARAEVDSKHDSQPVRKTTEVLMIDGTPYSKLIAEDGRPLSSERVREQEQKLRRETSKRTRESPGERRRRIDKYNEEREHDHKILIELAKAFDYTITGEQRIEGRDAWILHGIARPHYVPKSREAKVLIAMDVKFWIDKQTYQWPRIEAEVKMPVSMYMVGKVYPGTKFVLQQGPISSTLWLPKSFQVNVKATAFGFFNEDSSSVETYSDYRRAGASATPTGSRETRARLAR
jgi:hypothetical protein